MRRLIPIAFLAFLGLFARSAQSEVILQYFETRWDEIYQRLPEIAEIGYESMWTPPPGKSPIGGPYPFAYGGNVGYNSFDRFDLGDIPQRGNRETRYGSRTSLRNLVDNAHQADIKIYPDIVFNHAGNGPDFRTYPGMVPQDFHVWTDASQPGGFKRAPRMNVWTPDNGYGGTLNQELVSLIDIVLEFDNRFQTGAPNYAADPTPFVRHPGDSEKYPYFSQTGFTTENSRQFMVRWINWLGYAMDYDGVRLDAPKHVYKDFFGLPNQTTDVKNQTFLYNVQRNFKERRLGRAANTAVSDITFADMYKNDLRRNDAMIFSEFFIGSQAEVDYWRNPADRNWGIQSRYLDFPRKSALIMNAFNGSNLGALADTTSGFSPEEGVTFAHSHDENPPAKLELAYAYILTHIGVPIVYFSGNNLNASEIGRTQGKNTWMNKGYDYALGDTVNGFQSSAIPNLVYIHNQFCRGKEYNRWTENSYFSYERYDDLNSNGSPDSGEGLLLVVLNNSGSDQTRNGIQTSFSPGTTLKDYTGKNPSLVTVDGTGKVNITVGGWSGQGWGCWAPINAGAPATGDAISVTSSTGAALPTIPWVIPAGRDGVAKPIRSITRITGDSVNIDVAYSEPAQGGETVDSVIVKWGQGRNLNATATDFTGQDMVTGGFEQATRVGTNKQFRLVADLTGVPEGLHVIKARVFNGRTGKPALFQTFTKTVYVDRRGPELVFENLNAGETIQGARVITINNPDRTLFNLTYSLDGGAPQQADMVIRGKWRLNLSGLSSGNHSITLNAAEADYGSNRATINTSTLTRSFTVDSVGTAIAISHTNNTTLNEPFFKTVVTVPTGTATNSVKLYWDGYEQPALTENPSGSGKFESTFDGRYVPTNGVTRQFTGAFINGTHFFEAVVGAGTSNENRISRRVVFNLYGQNMQDTDGDGVPDEIELSGFLNGTNPGPDQAWSGDNSMDLIPNFGETWTRLNPMNANTDYSVTTDGDKDSDGDGVSNLQEVIKGFRISGNPYAYNIYSTSSVPPATVGSYATSALSMSGGNKIITVTYRPNDGVLTGATSVTVNFTPTGGGSPQSFTMTGGPTEFTYAYTAPAGATSVGYTFTSGSSTDSSGAASWTASTSAAFVMDGLFDSQNFLVCDNGMRIYAAIRGNKLYTATWSPKGGNNDHVILITDQFGNPINAGPATASDSASNYSSWVNGGNQGSGFDAWAISAGGSGSGVFLGDPAAAGIQGMSSKSFGLYANGGTTSSATAIRSFSALNVGDSISFQWGINWDGGNGVNGKKGFNLWAGTTFLMNAENAGTSDIVVGGSSSGMAFGTQAMNWSITRASATTLEVRATRRDGGVFTRTVTVGSSAPTRLEFYASNLAIGDQRQPYFNDLRIYRNGASSKGGQVYGAFDGAANSKPWIFSTPNTASQYGFKTSGRNWLGNQGAALESELDLIEAFGTVPQTLYIAIGAYSGGFGGTLLSQAPAIFGNSANDIEIPEFQALNTASIRDEDLDGYFDAGNPEMKVLVNGNETDGNYGLRRFYLDELANDTATLTVKFKPNAAPGTSVSAVEAYTNLNRRDKATLDESPSSVTASSDTYYRAYPMSGPDSSGYYSVDLPVNLCGAYRLQVRYKIAGVNSGNYIYYTDNGLRRDCAIVVSPKKALQLNMYEVNPLVVEAKNATFAGRSTFQDMIEAGGYDGRPDALNQSHYSAMGINMLWLQPIHPIGIEGRDTDPSTGQPFDPGSPYAVRDYWSVNPILGRGAGTSATTAMTEFQTFVTQLDQWGVGVMMDGTFNHSAPDAIMGQGAADLTISSNTSQRIRDFSPAWFAKEGFPAQQATNTNNIAIAPDRNDFGNWTDVREFYFGDYDALVKEKGTQNADKSYPDNAYKLAFLLERDKFEGFTNNAIRQVWDYFAYYPIYWLEKTGNTSSTPKSQSYKGIDGLRCDFAQGLPSQFWEYTINKTRARKWDFIFMAESLDGFREVGGSKRHGVGYRSARHFDILNENIVFYWRDTFFGYPANGGAGTVKTPDTYLTFKAYDDRRVAFDNVTLLNNLVGHDEVFPHNDPYRMAYAYTQIAAIDGAPMLFYGQEAGAQNSKAGYGASEANFGSISANRNFAKYETNFGKVIPNFKTYNHMTNIWNGVARDWTLQAFYGRVNTARLNSPALQSQNVYFLSRKGTNSGYDSKMFAVGKVKTPGLAIQDSSQDIRFVFVNNNHWANTNVANTFDLNAAAPTGSGNYFGIERGRNYNVRDLVSEKPTNFVWSTSRTGADLLDNGLYVGLPYLPSGGTNSFQAHLLQIVDVTAPTLNPNFPSSATYGTTLTLSSANSANTSVTYSLVGGNTNKVSLSGNQLTINSGTGSVTVQAVVAATADRPGATNSGTIAFTKATQTITFGLSPNTALVGDPSRTLIATSVPGRTPTLTSSQPSVASITGNTLYINAAGSTTISASDPGDENYLPAEAVTQTLTVTAADFASLWGNQTPASDANGDGVPALVEYALGGNPNSNNLGVLPQMNQSNNILTLSVLVRTNDPKLSVLPQASTDLGTGGWSSNRFTTNTSTAGVPEGYVRRTYIYDVGTNPRAFLRLFITNAP